MTFLDGNAVSEIRPGEKHFVRNGIAFKGSNRSSVICGIKTGIGSINKLGILGLFLKNIAMSIVYSKSAYANTTTFTNIGNIPVNLDGVTEVVY